MQKEESRTIFCISATVSMLKENEWYKRLMGDRGKQSFSFHLHGCIVAQQKWQMR
jgi:hypothetical protein